MEDTSAPLPWTLLRLLDGFVTTQLRYVAAKLGVADVLGERTANQLRNLRKASGFEVRDIVMTESPAGLGVVEATPA